MAAKSKSKAKKQKVIKDTVPAIICKGCPVKFFSHDRRQRFHTDSCREAFYERTYFAHVTVDKVCPNCGITYPTSKPGRQVYCKPACRIEHMQKKRDGTLASLAAERETFLGDRYSVLEQSKFRCSICGKSPNDGISLDVEEDGNGGLRAICNMCVRGREFNKSLGGTNEPV